MARALASDALSDFLRQHKSSLQRVEALIRPDKNPQKPVHASVRRAELRERAIFLQNGVNVGEVFQVLADNKEMD